MYFKNGAVPIRTIEQIDLIRLLAQTALADGLTFLVTADFYSQTRAGFKIIWLCA
jgi:hypothetical protein